MFIVILDGNDASCHTLEVDATEQKTRFENLGYSNVVVVEKDTFNPPQPE